MAAHTADDPIATFTGYLLVKVGETAAAVIERTVAGLGLRARHVRVLGFIDGETLSQQDLCVLTGMDRTTMVGVVDELERLGLARRERSATDRRKHVVVPTAEGAAVYRRALDLLLRAQEEFLAPLEPAQREQLNAIMRVLYGRRDPVCAPGDD